MSLVLKINACVVNNCTNIQFQELTGEYTAGNLGGYGGPNPGDMQAHAWNYITLTVTDPDNNMYVLNLDALLNNDYPSSTGFAYILPNDLLGNISSIKDGLWKFTYTIIDDNNDTYTVTLEKYFICNIESCLESKLLNLNVEDCNCNCSDNKYIEYNLLWVMFESLKNAIKCGDKNKFYKIF